MNSLEKNKSTISVIATGNTNHKITLREHSKLELTRGAGPAEGVKKYTLEQTIENNKFQFSIDFAKSTNQNHVADSID